MHVHAWACFPSLLRETRTQSLRLCKKKINRKTVGISDFVLISACDPLLHVIPQPLCPVARLCMLSKKATRINLKSILIYAFHTFCCRVIQAATKWTLILQFSTADPMQDLVHKCLYEEAHETLTSYVKSFCRDIRFQHLRKILCLTKARREIKQQM